MDYRIEKVGEGWKFLPEKEREEKKLLDYLEQIDPEAAEAYRMKEE
jgi:hypothetical protein